MAEEKQKREIFENFISQKNKISRKDLDDFFAKLDSVEADRMAGAWIGGHFPIGNSKLEFLLKDFIVFRWHGKNFADKDNVKALIFSFLGIKFSIPFASAVLRKIEYRNKISTSMIYDYLPIIDNFRKIDNGALFGISEIKGEDKIYFYLKRF